MPIGAVEVAEAELCSLCMSVAGGRWRSLEVTCGFCVVRVDVLLPGFDDKGV